jgi:regulator of protease activity HflC (stomatin/prohibitin superfamily)
MGDEITEAELAIAAAQVKQLAAEAGRQATEAARWRATAEVLSIKNKNLREALQTVVDLAEDGILPDGHDLEDFRTLLKPPAASRASSS